MNLMINNYCNLHCSYCFAQETMGSSNATNITIENFKTAIEWYRKLGERDIRFLGGEPTLHPQLDKLIDIVIEENNKYKCFDRILIFSNFTFEQEVADMLIKKNEKIPVRFLPNINELDLVLPNQRTRILYNLDYISTFIGLDTIGCNVYKPDLDFSLWEELITRYNIKNLRFSITIPNKALEDNFDFYTYFHGFQDTLLRLSEFTQKYGCEISNDCSPIPVCCFDAEVLKTLLLSVPNLFDRKYCNSETYDVLPDLTINGCFGTPVKNKKNILEFTSTNEVRQYLLKEKEQRLEMVARKECYECERYKSLGNRCCTCLTYRKIKR